MEDFRCFYNYLNIWCRSGGIGRRAWFRFMSQQWGGSSSLLFGTSRSKGFRVFAWLEHSETWLLQHCYNKNYPKGPKWDQLGIQLETKLNEVTLSSHLVFLFLVKYENQTTHMLTFSSFSIFVLMCGKFEFDYCKFNCNSTSWIGK